MRPDPKPDRGARGEGRGRADWQPLDLDPRPLDDLDGFGVAGEEGGRVTSAK